jgi:phosphoglycolate phosphatase-like HAD superfamily hydrolase
VAHPPRDRHERRSPRHGGGGPDVEQGFGDALRAGWAEEYRPLLDEIRPFDSARDLLEQLQARGHSIVLATSAPKDHLDRYVDLLDAGSRTDELASAEDADRTKPDPDLAVALRKGGGGPAVMIGDSPWDAVAASKVGIRTIAVRTGGFSVEERKDAGAVGIYGSVTELTDDLGPHCASLKALHRR